MTASDNWCQTPSRQSIFRELAQTWLDVEPADWFFGPKLWKISPLKKQHSQQGYYSSFLISLTQNKFNGRFSQKKKNWGSKNRTRDANHSNDWISTVASNAMSRNVRACNKIDRICPPVFKPLIKEALSGPFGMSPKWRGYESIYFLTYSYKAKAFLYQLWKVITLNNNDWIN